MRNRNINFTTKNIISKCSFMLILLSALSCTTVQYGLDAQKRSEFSTFNDLGIAKEEFIKRYGPPTNKGLYQESPAKKIEQLYYTEQVKSFLVTTVFIFENNILKEMKRVETNHNLQKIQEQLENIE